MAVYSDQLIEQIEARFIEVRSGIRQVRTDCLLAVAELTQEPAREYLLHGVGRRLGMIQRAAENIFDVFPATQEKPLSPDLSQEANINLHAFVINAYGMQDNLAWVFVHENQIKLPRLRVGLFRPECQAHLPAAIRLFLSDQRIIDWHETYAKDYRDALAHRIPLYIPPAQHTPEEAAKDASLTEEWTALLVAREYEKADSVHQQRLELGRAAPYFKHSYGDPHYMHLHPQLLADLTTIQELTRLFLQSRFRADPIGASHDL